MTTMTHEPPMTSGTGQFHTNEPGAANPKPYSQITWSEVRSMVDNPPSVPKTQGRWLIPSVIPSRSFKEQEARGRYFLLWADLDLDVPPIDTIARTVTRLIDGCDFEIYTSRSATADRLKARILIPIKTESDGPFGDWLAPFSDWHDWQVILNNKLEKFGLIPDRANERAAQLCYLPNRGEFYDSRSRRGMGYFSAHFFWHLEAMELKRIARERYALEEVENRALMARKASRCGTTADGLITVFNKCFTPQFWLLSWGYEQCPTNPLHFRHPASETGSYSARVTTDALGTLRVSTLSTADPLYLCGGKTGKSHDAFGVYSALYHAGVTRDALIKAGDTLITGCGPNGDLTFNQWAQIRFLQKK